MDDKQKAEFLMWQIKRSLSLLYAPEFNGREPGTPEYDRSMSMWAQEARKNLKWAVEQVEER